MEIDSEIDGLYNVEVGAVLSQRELFPFSAQVYYSGQRHLSRQTVADGRSQQYLAVVWLYGLFSIPYLRRLKVVLRLFFCFLFFCCQYLLYLVFHDCASSQVTATTRVPV